MQSASRHHVLKHARRLFRGRVVISAATCLTPEAEEYRTFVLDLFLSGTDSYTKYRRWVIGELLYGDFRNWDQYMIIDKHGIGKKNLVHLCVTFGVRALFPRRAFRTMQRNNWTGSDRDLDEIGLPTFVFGIFPAAYLLSIGDVKKPSAKKRARGLFLDPIC